VKNSKHQTPKSKEAPISKPQDGFASFENRFERLQRHAQGEFQNRRKSRSRRGNEMELFFALESASSRRRLLFSNTHWSHASQHHLEVAVWEFFGVWFLVFGAS
jgi:hypothetical protein